MDMTNQTDTSTQTADNLGTVQTGQGHAGSQVAFRGTRAPARNGVYPLADGRYSRFLDGQWRAPNADPKLAAMQTRMDAFASPQFRTKDHHRWFDTDVGIVASHDLTSFVGFSLAATQLLQDKGQGYALVDPSESGFMFLDGMEICSIELKDGDSLLNPEAVYSVDDSVCISPAAWEGDCWSTSTPDATQLTLLKPTFVRLKFAHQK